MAYPGNMEVPKYVSVDNNSTLCLYETDSNEKLKGTNIAAYTGYTGNIDDGFTPTHYSVYDTSNIADVNTRKSVCAPVYYIKDNVTKNTIWNGSKTNLQKGSEQKVDIPKGRNVKLSGSGNNSKVCTTLRNNEGSTKTFSAGKSGEFTVKYGAFGDASDVDYTVNSKLNEKITGVEIGSLNNMQCSSGFDTSMQVNNSATQPRTGGSATQPRTGGSGRRYVNQRYSGGRRRGR